MINVRINEEPTQLTPRITVVGVGGAGGNAVNNMIRSGLEGCEFLVCNTDHQALQQSLADRKIQLGASTTRGLGAGARPDVGRAAAEETIEDILGYLEGSNMVFITCGMGGGTGTGAAPVIARAAKEQGILTVGVATKPFHFEGATRMRLAEEGLKELQQYVDTLIIIPNQNLFRIANEKTTFADAFKMADDVLMSGVRGVTDLMVMPGQINLDFSDVKSVMAEMGKAMMGTGEAEGDKRAIQAAEAAISNPLLDDISMKGARGVLINITGGADLTLFEIDEAANRIRDEVDPEANIIFGSTFMENMEGKMRVSVVATGIDVASMVGTIDHQAPKTTTPGIPAAPARSSDVRTQASVSTGKTSTATPPQQSDESKVETAQTATLDIYEEEKVSATGTGSVTASSAPHPGIRTQNGHHIPAAGGTGQGTTGGRIGDNISTVTGQARPSYTTGSNIPSYAASQAPARGQRVQGSFIPPKPKTMADMDDQTGQPSYGHTQTVTQAQPQTHSPQTQSAQEKKSPSLFERLSDSLRGRGHQEKETEMQERRIEPSLEGAQKTLGIETEQPKDSEDDLDIPAFLRRQAN